MSFLFFQNLQVRHFVSSKPIPFKRTVFSKKRLPPHLVYNNSLIRKTVITTFAVETQNFICHESRFNSRYTLSW
ncbi:hypothetical protein Hanom_Chr11g01032151 [Helianthus anomalus]